MSSNIVLNMDIGPGSARHPQEAQERPRKSTWFTKDDGLEAKAAATGGKRKKEKPSPLFFFVPFNHRRRCRLSTMES